ncbi:MAG: ABC transporter ATP-binding protein [Candidatus Microsaccharimonas sp.]
MNSKEIAISVKDIHKSFILPQLKSTSLKQAAVNIVRKNNITTQKVLDGVSFDIHKGDFFGIVGRNGSGKSTLLKLIAGVYSPAGGSIEVNGGLTPFIELGVGFNQELSGRDNVFLNGALLGYTRKQMEAMYDDIVEFAEIEEHMDKKLKNYSSGMQVRLAFSIAIKAKNDILIFDEVLAVGDEAFQKKCMAVFREYKKNKQTIVLVTHSMENVITLCNRALMLEDGKVVTIGDVKKVARAYQKSNLPLDTSVDKDGLKKVSKNLISISGNDPAYKMGEPMKVTLSWPKSQNVAWAGVSISGINGEYLFGTNTGIIEMTGNSIDYDVDLNLGPGDYYLTAAIKDLDGNLLESHERIATFTVYSDYDPMIGGLTRMEFKYTTPKRNKVSN